MIYYIFNDIKQIKDYMSNIFNQKIMRNVAYNVILMKKYVILMKKKI